MRYEAWKRRLGAIEGAGRWRSVEPLEPTGPTTALLHGREVIVACSNDYLGLSWSLRGPFSGGGSGGSRLISGDRHAHHRLEDALEARFQRPALLFPSGYHANLAVCATVCEAGDLVCSDALNHASLIDGLRLGRARRRIVPHADPTAIPPDARLVALEGVYSMDGDIPDFSAYPADPWLFVDEAHAVGALGPGGTGAAASRGVVPDVLVGTFGKAYGAAGAFVIGPPELKQLLVNAARSFIFTTAMPEPVAQMALAGLEAASDELRERLAQNARSLRSGLTELGWQPLGTAHIVPVVVGDRVMEIAERLLARGVYARGIRWPTVPRGQERIRFTVSAAHTPDQLDTILEAMS